MALLPIRIFGDPVLRTRARAVEEFDAALAALAADLLETMRWAEGAGLAANQVGVLKRLFTWEEGQEHGALVNPEVVELSEETELGDEGCLSFPGLFYPTERPLRARLRARDVHGDEVEQVAEGLRARIFLHELDHLNGVLFIDHLARHDRAAALRRVRDGELEEAARLRDARPAEAPPRPDGSAPAARRCGPG